MRKRYFAAILLIACTLPAISQIAVKSFRILPTDQTARVIAPLKDQNGEKCALIRIVTTENGFEFEAGMLGIMKTLKKTGEYWVYIPHGSKKITILHNHLGVLRNYVYPEAIQEAMVYEMVLTTGRVKTIIEEPEMLSQWVVITTDPEGADVYIDDIHRGQTPFQQEFKEGKHTYRISKELYHTEAGQFDLLSLEGKKRMDYELKPNYGYARIKAFPEDGAAIEIDGVSINKETPYKINRIKSGKHTVKLTHEWYETNEQDFEITDGETTDVFLDLSPKFADVMITSIPDAEIYIDDKLEGQGTFSSRLLDGKYKLEIKKPMYHGISENINIKAGEPFTRQYELKPAFGGISISTTPENGAEVLVDDVPTGKITPCTLDQISDGEHIITLRREWYEPRKIRVNIEEGMHQEITEELIPTYVETDISTTPEANIYIDGKKVGFGTYTGRVVTGIHTFEARKDKHHPDIQKTEVMLGKDYNISLTPMPKYGTLKIISDPFDAEILINGKESGTTPKTFHKLLVGEYNIEIRTSGYSPYTQKATIEENITEEVNATLRSTKKVTIISDPAGADIDIDYDYIGITPYTAELSFGEHVINLSLDDYEDFSKTYQITENTNEVNIKLSGLDVVQEIFTVVEQMPQFPGGETAMYNYLSQNLIYPQVAKESGIQGRVYVTFVVETNGSLSDIRILRGIGGGCDEAALKAIRSMPRWVPGKQRGIPVRVQYNLPIKFSLR